MHFVLVTAGGNFRAFSDGAQSPLFSLAADALAWVRAFESPCDCYEVVYDNQLVDHVRCGRCSELDRLFDVALRRDRARV